MAAGPGSGTCRGSKGIARARNRRGSSFGPRGSWGSSARNVPDPDVLIRTSGEMRVSNFLLWQISYTELVVTQTLWPDFRNPQLYAALEEYHRRHRRFGAL